jgi:hypothetical protein
MQVFTGVVDLFAGSKLRLRHKVETCTKYGFINAYLFKMLRSDTKKIHTRLSYKSFQFSVVNTAFFLMILGGLIALDVVIKDKLYAYSLGDG